MTLVIKKASGGVAVMRLIGDAEAATCLEQWKAVNSGEYVSHAEVAEESLPQDRSERAMWDLVNGAVVVVVPPLNRAGAAQQIDDAAAAVYGRFTRFAQEYEEREAQANAFKSAGYTGTVPRQVAAFATAAGKTATDATDTILAQAAQLRGALDDLGALRMRKYEVLRAADDATARAVLAEVLAGIATIGSTL